METPGNVLPAPLAIPLSVDGSKTLLIDVGPRPTKSRPALGSDGWAALFSPAIADAGMLVALRLGLTSDDPVAAIQIKDLHVTLLTATEPFASPVFRTISFVRITAAINRVDNADRIRPLLPPVASARGRSRSPFHDWMRPPAEPVLAPVPDLRLTVPQGRGRRPDAFYAEVADAYLAEATLNSKPARALADANDVPVTTVHRWLKEARVRGLLRLPGQSSPAFSGTGTG